MESGSCRQFSLNPDGVLYVSLGLPVSGLPQVQCKNGTTLKGLNQFAAGNASGLSEELAFLAKMPARRQRSQFGIDPTLSGLRCSLFFLG